MVSKVTKNLINFTSKHLIIKGHEWYRLYSFPSYVMFPLRIPETREAKEVNILTSDTLECRGFLAQLRETHDIPYFPAIKRMRLYLHRKKTCA